MTAAAAAVAVAGEGGWVWQCVDSGVGERRRRREEAAMAADGGGGVRITAAVDRGQRRRWRQCGRREEVG